MSEAVDRLEVIITTTNGTEYLSTFSLDNVTAMEEFKKLEEWLSAPNGGMYPFPVHEVQGPERSLGFKKTMREGKNLFYGSKVFLSQESIASVLVEKHAYLRSMNGDRRSERHAGYPPRQDPAAD